MTELLTSQETNLIMFAVFIFVIVVIVILPTED